ncbi:MAG: PEGA domain-containing protein [Palaeococcus sp.]|uniref:PEGA domain-containing protein n=1 Tax=Palaeococcus sp. (in: euryarchaeotes) TaxID=2820298 RepID=UPI0025FEE018|nr:PEGA domain-containing protein [Palaeococcus sp. (in: euryarchaeotes)]MCD6558741.1 PEGA domain-containing protein [Palaeococcus sp. (in: euryarchaeotes)]
MKNTGVLLISFLLLVSSAVPAKAFDEWATLRVRSDVPGISITIDGKALPNSTLLKLPRGNHIIKVNHDGIGIEYPLEVHAGDILTLEVSFEKIKKALEGPFTNITVKYGYNGWISPWEEHPSPRDIPPVKCSVSAGPVFKTPFGFMQPLLVQDGITKKSYYMLEPENIPIWPKCKSGGDVVVLKVMDPSGAGRTELIVKNTTYIAPVASLHIETIPENASISIFDYHWFGRWFSPMLLKVPVILEPPENITVKYYETTEIIPKVPEIQSYRLSFALENYPYVEGWVNLMPEREFNITVNLELLKEALDLKRAWGTLDISTEPEGARIIVKDDKGDVIDEGVSPLRINLPPGYYVVTGIRGNYSGLEEIMVSSNRTIMINLNLTRKRAELKINTPKGADALIANRTCRIPCQLSLPPGYYNITVKKEGYVTRSKNIILKSGENKSLNFELKPLPRILINTEPSGAAVFLDNKEFCKTPCNLTLQPGLHELTLELEGFESKKITVRVKGGEILPLNISLREKASPEPLQSSFTLRNSTIREPYQYPSIGKLIFITGCVLLALILFTRMRR